MTRVHDRRILIQIDNFQKMSILEDFCVGYLIFITKEGVSFYGFVCFCPSFYQRFVKTRHRISPYYSEIM